jgi:predicted GIY-YIG superfamily endonuclease
MEKYWTKEKCFEVAKTCKTIKEFIKNYNTAYVKSIIHGWRKDYTWLERTIKLDMETPNYLIYVYEDVSDKVCYVGLTNNLIKRKSQHKSIRYYKNREGIKYLYRDTVNEYFFEKGEQLPEPKILETGLNAIQAQDREDYWCKYYRNNNWTVLNKAKTGKNSSSLGGCQKKWTYEKLKEEASKYKTKEEFKKKKNSAYKIARENNFLEDFYPSGFECLPNEEWKDIIGYEGLYQMSNFKRVKHLKGYSHKSERLVSIGKKRDKFLIVSLYKNNKNKIFYIDKLYEEIWGKQEGEELISERLNTGSTQDRSGSNQDQLC